MTKPTTKIYHALYHITALDHWVLDDAKTLKEAQLKARYHAGRMQVPMLVTKLNRCFNEYEKVEEVKP